MKRTCHNDLLYTKWIDLFIFIVVIWTCTHGSLWP